MISAQRVVALSDLHVDYRPNLQKFESLTASVHGRDALLLGGDVTHDLGLLERTLRHAHATFAAVFFVPGNHELWLRDDRFADSLAKFEHILGLCADLGVHTAPARVAGGPWIVPLFSWYVRPEEGPDSLYGEKPGEDPTLSMWLDNQLVRWPDGRHGGDLSEHFLARNEPHLREYDAPVISFSHFLPRRDLMFRSREERTANVPFVPDRMPAFNFSRVAGAAGIERQLRALGATVHVYGHQHRNRDRVVDGVRYVSHCLGYPREYEGVEQDVAVPKVVWSAPS